MINEPLFSVIVTTYNRARLLPRAINSVLNQTYQNLELIIVDGGSSDSTEEVIRSFKDKRIRFRKQKENRGMLADRNTGFGMSKGKYIALLDDDDELLPRALETAVDEFSKLSSEGIGILWFNCIESESGELTGKGKNNSGYVSYEDNLCGKVYGNFWEVIDSNLMDKDSRFDERLWGLEIMFWLKLHQRTKVFYVHKVLRINHTECSTVSTFENQLKHVSRIVLSEEAYLEKYGNSMKHLCPRKYSQELAILSFWQILNGDRLKGRITIVNAIKHAHAPRFCVFLLLSFLFSQSQIITLYAKLFKVGKALFRNL